MAARPSRAYTSWYFVGGFNKSILGLTGVPESQIYVPSGHKINRLHSPKRVTLLASARAIMLSGGGRVNHLKASCESFRLVGAFEPTL